MALKQNISIANYNYNLPEEKIARYPLTPRHNSKLLIYKGGKITDHTFRDIPQFLPNNSLLVYNNTRVIHARLHFRKATGAKIEIFCLEPINPNDHQLSFQQTKRVTWKCMVGGLKKWKSEVLHKEIQIDGQAVDFRAEIVDRNPDNLLISFNWNSGTTFSKIIENTGIIPIPPYLNRDSEETDKLVYQTVYAKHEGSVAAPTAGLHFTKKVFDGLRSKNISECEVTLHVGAGTFQPVKTDNVAEHTMHAEWISISLSTIQTLLQHLGNITSVGTTTVRTLESLYWLGKKILKNPELKMDALMVDQWGPYNNLEDISATESLDALTRYMKKKQVSSLRFFTQIIIVPGYDFKLVNRIVTNFHQPTSTLLLLVSAFIGNDWKKVYQHALKNNYRFLSFGDSSLLMRG